MTGPILKATPRPKRRGHRDPVTPEMREYILNRDGGCVARRAAGWRIPGVFGGCDGRVEVDHVLNGGIGKRGPSVKTNLVLLCSAHHRSKTDNARSWRPLLVAYLERVEQAA